MVEQTRKPIGCLSLFIGAFLSIFISGLLLESGGYDYDNALGRLLMPGWSVFRPGRDDGREILMAVVMDIMLWWAITYCVLSVILNRISKTRFK